MYTAILIYCRESYQTPVLSYQKQILIIITTTIYILSLELAIDHNALEI